MRVVRAGLVIVCSVCVGPHLQLLPRVPMWCRSCATRLRSSSDSW